jgi:hypothetical protein
MNGRFVPLVPAEALRHAHMLGHERECSVRGAKSGATASPHAGEGQGGGHNPHSGCLQSDVEQMPFQDF